MLNEGNALVLWLEMLGYKNWLSCQEDLAKAEQQLLHSLKIMYKTLTDEPSRLSEVEIRTILISDTVIVWSFQWDIQTWIAINMMYHVLASELGRLGLAVRGALSIGPLRIRDEEPRTVLGHAIVYCSSLERMLDEFVVAIDDSVLDAIKKTPDSTTMAEFMSMLSLKKVATKVSH